jgi:hypothetical protein
MASDIPHLDYIERHFWLKCAYLRKHKWLLLNDGAPSNKKDINGFLLSYINNAEVLYEELLQGIGFGIRCIEEIESPILNLKTNSKRILSNVIFDYLNYPLVEDEDEDDLDPEPMKDVAIIGPLENCCTVNEFIEFLYLESHSHSNIFTIEGYHEWETFHPSRCAILELPTNPEKQLRLLWSSIIEKVYALYIECGVDDVFCSVHKFVGFMKEFSLTFKTIDEYQKWHKTNIENLYTFSLPKDPNKFYGKKWEKLNEMILTLTNSSSVKLTRSPTAKKIMKEENFPLSISENCSLKEFIYRLCLIDNTIQTQSAYEEYIRENSSQVVKFKLPNDPVLAYRLTWYELTQCCHNAIQFKGYKLSSPIDTAIKCIKESRIQNYCSYSRYIASIASKFLEYDHDEFEDYDISLTSIIRLFKYNEQFFINLKVTEHPIIIYERSWEEIIDNLCAFMRVELNRVKMN